MHERFRGLSVEGRQFLLKALKQLNEDYHYVRGEESRFAIQRRIYEFSRELERYKKPVFEFDNLNENEIYRYHYVDFTDDELLNIEEVVEELEIDMDMARAVWHFNFQ